MEMEFITQIIQRMDVGTIVVMAVMFWLHNSRLDKKFEAIEKKFEMIERRFDKLEDKVNDINLRLVRMEGAFAAKDFCVMKSDSKKEAG